MKKEQKLGFADFMVEKRKIKQEFFNQVNQLVDWRLISNIINKYYQKGESATGRASYEGIVLFKMALLQTWYGLSDYEVEDRMNDSISFSRFVGISLDDNVPDHSVLSRFRTEREKLRNKLIGKTRFKVERTFGGIKRWFNSTYARYKGMAKMHTQNLMEAIAYNLYRSPGRITSNSFEMTK